MLTRRKPMPPGKPLRRTPFRSSSVLKTVTTLKRSRPKRTAPRKDTGFSASVKLAVRTRAGLGDPNLAACEACGIRLGPEGGQVQHIVARQAGGRGPKAPSWINEIVNAALLCGTPFTGDHGLCEDRDEHMHAMGFWLTQDQDPRLEPMMLHGAAEGGGGIAVWRGEDGSYLYQAPGVAA